MSDLDALRADNARLEEENAALRTRVAALENTLKGQAIAASLPAKLALLVAGGPRLALSLRAWFRKTREGDPLPVDETADVLGAVVRRLVGVRVLALLIGVLPVLLLIWQNVLLRGQLELQEVANRLERRVELATILYEGDCDRTPCAPTHAWRARQEAVRALVELERRSGDQPSLERALLQDVRLVGVDLSELLLDQAILDRANLSQAELDGSSLRNARLAEVTLVGASLREASLIGANLRGAYLDGADLRGASLLRAELQGARLVNADLRNAELQEAELSGAVYDRRTRFPGGFDPAGSGMRLEGG